MPRSDFRHQVPLRVRWAEVDMQAVVFNGHYLTYADVCATEYWRAIGFAYPQAFAALGVDAYVRKATIEYHAPARYDDQLLLCGRIARLGRSSAGFTAALYREADDKPLVDVDLVYVCVDTQGAPVPWPAAIRRAIGDFEPRPPAQEAGRG